MRRGRCTVIDTCLHWREEGGMHGFILDPSFRDDAQSAARGGLRVTIVHEITDVKASIVK